MNLVSVIIPTYNRAHTIQRAIDSVLSQSYRNLELLIIDDGSVDATEQLIKKIQDPRIRYHKLDRNSGPSAARNAGIRLASGKYIAFQDSDDQWLPEKLQKQVWFLDKFPQYAMVYCAFQMGELIVPNPEIPLGELSGDIYNFLTWRNTVGTPTMVVRKEVFEGGNTFNESLSACEDWELVVRIGRDYKIGYINEILVQVYPQPGSVNSNKLNAIKGRFYIMKTYRRR